MMLPVNTVAEDFNIKAGRLSAGRRSPQRASGSKHQAAAENTTPDHAFAGDLAKRRRAVHLSESSLHCGA